MQKYILKVDYGNEGYNKVVSIFGIILEYIKHFKSKKGYYIKIETVSRLSLMTTILNNNI